MLMGTAFVVDRGNGEQEKRGEALQFGQMEPDRFPEENEEPETEARLRWWARAAVAMAVLLTVLLSLLPSRSGIPVSTDLSNLQDITCPLSSTGFAQPIHLRLSYASLEGEIITTSNCYCPKMARPRAPRALSYRRCGRIRWSG
jgi:hypothetical protein